MKRSLLCCLILCCLLVAVPSLADPISVDCLAEHEGSLYRVDMGLISRMTGNA